MKQITTGRWLVRHALVLMVAIILINFGFWQLRRLEEKRTRNANILATLEQPAITLTGEEIDPEALHFRRVRVEGTFDNAESMVLRNKSLNNTPGIHLLTPLRTSNREDAILIDRGWLPNDQADPSRRTAYDVNGVVTVEGIAYRTQTRPSSLSPLDRLPDGQTRLDAWFRVDIDLIQGQLSYPLLPVFIAQLPAPGAEPGNLPRQDGNIELDEGPHLGYAVQWFSFAVILGVIYAFFIRKELTDEEG